MSRRVSHADLHRPHLQPLAVGQLVVRRRGCAEPQTQPLALLREPLIERPVGGMQINRGPRRGGDLGDAEDVVEVRMGEPDRRDAALPPRGLQQEARRLLAGIDQDRVRGRGIVNQVTVLGELSVGDRDDFEAGVQAASAAPRDLRSVRYFSTAIAAVVASPTAVVTWRVS